MVMVSFFDKSDIISPYTALAFITRSAGYAESRI
jgi:hypothetical protein